MPTYEYYCAENGRTVEVLHAMSRTLTTWCEVCEAAEVDPASTPADTPVEKLLGAGMVLSRGAAEAVPACGSCGEMPGSCAANGAFSMKSCRDGHCGL